MAEPLLIEKYTRKRNGTGIERPKANKRKAKKT
jgi:hypothetical protein